MIIIKLLPELYKSKLPSWLQNIKIDSIQYSVDNDLVGFPNHRTRRYDFVSRGTNYTLESEITDLNTNKKYFVNFYKRHTDNNLIEVEIIPFSEYGLD